MRGYLSHERREKVVAALTSEPQALRALGGATGLDHTTLNIALNELLEAGRAHRVEIGTRPKAKHTKWGWLRA
jgi:phage FluMu gp28-like protein